MCIIIDCDTMTIDTKKVDQIIKLRLEAKEIQEFAGSKMAFCSDISCTECPLNVGRDEIICLNGINIIR